MTDTNQLPPLPNTSKLFEDDNNIVIGYTADQMRAYALQARAQVLGEPVFTSRFGRVVLSGPREDVEFAVRHLPDVDDKTTTPQPAQATQAEVTDGIRPEDFTVDVVVKPMGGFAPVNTQGVRVTHKPTGISVTCDAARSQHTNRHQAFETLRTILALRPERVVDVRCEGCGYMTHHREHMGCVRAAKQHTHPAPSVPADVVRDAERYRWLRDHDHWPAPFSSSQEPEPVRGRDLDAAIDAAMLAAKDSK